MKVIPFDRSPAQREAGSRNSGVVLLLAATLAAGGGTVFGAEQVERGDAAAPASAVPPAPGATSAKPAMPAAPLEKSSDRTQSERDRDARLEDAKRRLEQAAAEVAALSSEIASQAMQSFSEAFAAGPRRSIIGVQLEEAASGEGAKVQEVSPGGAAEEAGVRAGDVIVAVNGTTVKGGAREVVRMLRQVAPDTKVQLRVIRDGKPRDFSVTARRFDPRTYAYHTPPNFNFNFDNDLDPSRAPFGPSWPFGPSAISGGLAGMELTTLTPQLARYFGTDKGLLVLRAPKNDLYKLQDGDVILSIDGRVPSNGSHITRILQSYQPGEKLTMHIMRDRKPLDLQITLPEATPRRHTRAARMLTHAAEI